MGFWISTIGTQDWFSLGSYFTNKISDMISFHVTIGCTSTNAPVPIKIPQMSVLKQE
jgi:hypothetical protein